MHAMRVTTASTLGSMPGALAFSCNMFLNVPLIADWHTIAQCRDQYVNETFAAPSGSDVSMTMLQVRKF
jgi:hypothetical protein